MASDEIWYYHAGAPARQLLLAADGTRTCVLIGPPELPEAVPQSVIPAGCWQTAWLEPAPGGEAGWGLFGAAVFPGFEYGDFTAASDDEICARFPAHRLALTDWLRRRPTDAASGR